MAKAMHRYTGWAVADEKGRLLHYADYAVPNVFRTRKEALEEIDGYHLEGCAPVRVAITPC